MNLTPIGRAVRATGAARFYKDGDGAGFVWRWWHPMAWLGALFLLVLAVAAEGAPTAWRYREDCGLRLKPWFVQHPDRLEWL